MNGKQIWTIVIAALLGAGLFAAGLLVGLTFSPRLEPAMAARSVRPGREQGPPGERGERPRLSSEPLTMEEVRRAADEFLRGANLETLEVGRLLVFADGAYVAIVKAGSGAGAFELQVSALTRSASVELGPTMLWNAEFGLASGHFPGIAPDAHRELRQLLRVARARGHMGGSHLRLFRRNSAAVGLPPEARGGVTEEEALAIAGRYLRAHAAGFTLGHQVRSFPGYFTFEVLKDEVVHGLISVNAETGQVWPHRWQGKILAASD
ncbi:MAG: hypothetical protein ACRDHY_07775 [Anaerolineales bacterium]